MKSVEVMLNFLRKRTSKRQDSTGKTGEPPIMVTAQEHGAHDDDDDDDNGDDIIRRGDRRKRRLNSEVFERESGRAANSNFRSIHSSCSSSLDETRFLAIQTNSHGGVYTKNRRKPSLASNLDDSFSETQSGIMQPLNEEPSRLHHHHHHHHNNSNHHHHNHHHHHSPKFSQRLSSSHRSSGHTRSLSTLIDTVSRSSDRGTDPSRTSIEVTPRLYRKNAPQSKPLPLHTPSSPNQSPVPQGVNCSSPRSQSSKWSFWHKGSTSPVPPPRKRRSKGKDSEGERSSQTSSSPDGSNEDELSSGRRLSAGSDGRSIDDLGVVESPEFRFDLPTDFSDLGLDILNIPTAGLSTSKEKSSFDLVQEIDRSRTEDLKFTEHHPTLIKSGDILRIEPATGRKPDPESNITLDQDRFSSSVCDSSFESVFQNDPSKSSKNQRLQSELIVKSIFGGKSQNTSEKVSNQFTVETGKQTTTNHNHPKGDVSVDRSHPNTSSELFHSSSTIPVSDNFGCDSGSYSLNFSEISADESSLLCLSSSDWNRDLIDRRGFKADDFRASQPDVLIGTQRNPPLNCCSSSSFTSDQEMPFQPLNDSGHSTMKPFTCDLTVCHQLHGFPSKTSVTICEKSTTRNVIEKVLSSEEIPDNWFLFELLTISVDPRSGQGGAVELNMDDNPAQYLNGNENYSDDDTQFELRRKDGLKIRINCDSSSVEKPKSMTLEISSKVICRFVIEAAVQKFQLKSPSKFCLIEVNRSREGYPLRRVGESEVVAQLGSDYFLLGDRELLFEPRGGTAVGPSPRTPPSIASVSRFSYLPSSSSSSSSSSPRTSVPAETVALKTKLIELEAKVIESERLCQQKLKKEQSRMERYRSIAMSSVPNEKVHLLEEEFQRLSADIQSLERQIQTQKELHHITSESKESLKREKLLSMEANLVRILNERKEIYECLSDERAKIQKQSTTNGHCISKNSSSSNLYRVCQQSQGSCLYGLEIDRSKLNRVELFPCSERNGGQGGLRVGRSNGCRQLSEGDKILEINGELVYHLNEADLVALLGKTLEKLRIVILRDAVTAKNVYML